MHIIQLLLTNVKALHVIWILTSLQKGARRIVLQRESMGLNNVA